MGRVTINELKRRGIKGEHLRRQIWDPRTPSTTSINARFGINPIIYSASFIEAHFRNSRCVTPVPGAAPSAAAMLLMDINGGSGVVAGGGNTTTGVVEHNNLINGDPFLDNPFCFGANFNDLSGFANSNKPNNVAAHLAEPRKFKPLFIFTTYRLFFYLVRIVGCLFLVSWSLTVNQEVFNAALLNKLSITSTFIEDVVESSYTAPVAASIPEPPKTIFPPLPPLPTVIPLTSVSPESSITPVTPVATMTPTPIFPPLHPPKEIEAVIEHLDNSAQLSDIENEIIAQTLLGSVVPVSNHAARTSIVSATLVADPPKETLPPLFRARLLDTPTLSVEGDFIGFGNNSDEKPLEIRRQQSSPVLFQRANSIDLTRVQQRQSTIIDESYQSTLFTDTETKCTRLLPLVVEEKLIVTPPDSSGKNGKRNSKSRLKSKHQFSRSNVVAPSMDEPTIYALEDHFTAPPDHVQDSSIFQRLNERSNHQLTRSTTDEESQRYRKKPKLKSSSLNRRRHSDNESFGSSSGVDESLYTATRVASRKPRMDSRSSSASSAQQNMAFESDSVTNPPISAVQSVDDPQIPTMIFHISGNFQGNPSVEDDSPDRNPSPRKSTFKKLTPRRSKLSSIKKVKKFTLFNKKDTPAILSVAMAAETNKILSSTSSRIDQAKADHFHSSAPAVMNLNHLLSGSESILTDDIDT